MLLLNPRLNQNGWVIAYHLFYVDVITYPYPNLNTGLANLRLGPENRRWGWGCLIVPNHGDRGSYEPIAMIMT